MEPKRHAIWDMYPEITDFARFKKHVESLSFIDDRRAPEAVVSHFERARKLLIYSYFEYEFIDLALNQAVMALERALRLKYTELTGVPNKKLKFQELLDWAHGLGYFEIGIKKILEHLRGLRNHLTHGEEKTLGGVAFWEKVFIALNLINDLYEDSDLRAIRKRSTKEIDTLLTEIVAAGSLLECQGRKTIVFDSQVIFVNNKKVPNILTLALWEIFDPANHTEARNIIHPPLIFDIDEWSFNNEGFEARTIMGENIRLCKLSQENHKVQFVNWITEIQALKHIDMILQAIRYPLTSDLNRCLQNFYKQG